MLEMLLSSRFHSRLSLTRHASGALARRQMQKSPSGQLVRMLLVGGSAHQPQKKSKRMVKTNALHS